VRGFSQSAKSSPTEAPEPTPQRSFSPEQRAAILAEAAAELSGLPVLEDRVLQRRQDKHDSQNNPTASEL
jgi:hypothetical protein